MNGKFRGVANNNIPNGYGVNKFIFINFNFKYKKLINRASLFLITIKKTGNNMKDILAKVSLMEKE